ncbi:MAG: STM4015 family protein, partial [Cyanobacteriota bacterium]
MNNNPNQPREDDAVLGGQATPPKAGVILGGIEGVKSRLESAVVEVRITALSEALKYRKAGLDLVISALKDESKQVRRSAYQLLRYRKEPQVKQALQQYKPWNLVERLEKYPGYKGNYVSRFANRPVEEFDPEDGITNPVSIAYALRCEYEDELEITDKFATLLKDPRANELEALVFGMWNDLYECSSSSLVNALVNAGDQLTNLKAVFVGDVPYDECEISWIVQSDISPVLAAYPKLEVLQVRGGESLAFSPLRHEHLEALIVETGGLSRTTVAQICALNLPALQHLELWFGSHNYGGDCWIDDLTPIIKDQVFPNLIYLGLRNSQFSDEIAEAIAYSPLIDSIKVLDLSMGTLSDRKAEELLDCSAVNTLDILNVSENFLSDKVIERLRQLEVQV